MKRRSSTGRLVRWSSVYERSISHELRLRARHCMISGISNNAWRLRRLRCAEAKCMKEKGRNRGFDLNMQVSRPVLASKYHYSSPISSPNNSVTRSLRRALVGDSETRPGTRIVSWPDHGSDSVGDRSPVDIARHVSRSCTFSFCEHSTPHSPPNHNRASKHGPHEPRTYQG